MKRDGSDASSSKEALVVMARRRLQSGEEQTVSEDNRRLVTLTGIPLGRAVAYGNKWNPRFPAQEKRT